MSASEYQSSEFISEPDESPELSSILKKIDHLPALPALAQKVGDLVNDPNADVTMVADVLRRDQSLTAAVLKIANSAYYGIPGGVSDVRRAISFLGFNTIYQIVLAASVVRTFGQDSSEHFDPKELWKYSVACASTSEIIARRIEAPDISVYFTAGLLHDIGKVALLKAHPREFVQAIDQAKFSGTSLVEVERSLGLPTHLQVGSGLARRWRFPMPLRIAIERDKFLRGTHREQLPADIGSFADVTQLSDCLVRRLKIGDPGDLESDEVESVILKRLRISRLDLKDIMNELLTDIERSRVLLELLA